MMGICYYRMATLNENVAWTSREMLWNLEVYLNNTLDVSLGHTGHCYSSSSYTKKRY